MPGQRSDSREASSRSGPIFLAWECFGLLHAGVSLTLDLSGVDFVDRRGVESLRHLGQEGVEIRCRCGAVASVLEAEGVRITVDPGALNP